MARIFFVVLLYYHSLVVSYFTYVRTQVGITFLSSEKIGYYIWNFRLLSIFSHYTKFVLYTYVLINYSIAGLLKLLKKGIRYFVSFWNIYLRTYINSFFRILIHTYVNSILGKSPDISFLSYIRMYGLAISVVLFFCKFVCLINFLDWITYFLYYYLSLNQVRYRKVIGWK